MIYGLSAPPWLLALGALFPPGPSLEVLGIGGITGDLEAGDSFQDEETGGTPDCVVEGSALFLSPALVSLGMSSPVRWVSRAVI